LNLFRLPQIIWYVTKIHGYFKVSAKIENVDVYVEENKQKQT